MVALRARGYTNGRLGIEGESVISSIVILNSMFLNFSRIRGGPQYDRDIGDPGICISAVAGIPIQRLSGLITCGDIISGNGFRGELHELVHGVSGFEYHRALEAARTGDGMVSQTYFTRQICYQCHTHNKLCNQIT